MKEYDHKKIEEKWQRIWEKEKTFKADDNSTKSKFYSLIEFPYPSGDGLHVGHVRSNTAMDVISRKRRLEGYNVLYPIGWDAFGLPTENYAIKTGIHPEIVTKENTDKFREQLKKIGFAFDWDREINTTDPEYYKWTQWIFLQMFKLGLAYKKKMPINWCLSCKIGLANEEVVDGRCERCGGEVEKRDKEQWMLAITKYADRLEKDLDEVDFLPQIKLQQKNWIGRSEGAELEFQIKDTNTKVKIFTTRPDTLFGVTYIVLAPESDYTKTLLDKISNKDEIVQYTGLSGKKSEIERADAEKEKTGVEMKGIVAINPANNEEVPVYVADYVLANYGTGAVMAVPAHDERDFVFAQKYNLGIKQVVAPFFIDIDNPPKDGLSMSPRRVVQAIVVHPTEDKVIQIKWKGQPWQTLVIGGAEKDESYEEAVKREVSEETGYKNFKRVYPVGWQMESRYYAAHKDVNRQAFVQVFVVELADLECDKLTEEEQEKHDVVWVPKTDFPERFNPISEKPHIIESLKNGPSAYEGEGVIINSGEFDGEKNEEAKWKITEFVGGKKVTTYKLRDWVFSRQRYWGEPIPIIHCENCAKRKYNFVFVHGFKGSVKEIFWPWLKTELEKMRHSVSALDLPNPETPSTLDQTEFILKNNKFDENTVLIGHSLGGVVMYRILEKLEIKIAKAIFIDPVVNPDFNDHDRASVEKSDSWQFDFEKIKNGAEDFIILADNNFPIIKKEHLQELGEKLGVPVNFASAEDDHFCAEIEPEILRVFERESYIPLRDSDLPLKLPHVDKYEPTDNGESPLSVVSDFVNVKCPRCGGKAKRETDTMPNWAGSSWYYLAYTMQGISNFQFPIFKYKETFGHWLPVNWYNGGMEHVTLHLLYSRFWHKFLYDQGYVPTKEPYKKRTTHGLILAEDGSKMSKSKGNVINPDSIVERFGADSLRLYEMFMGPFDQPITWDTNGLVGVRRFLEKVWKISGKVSDVPVPKNIETLLHKTIKKVSEDIEEMKFNTAVSALMIMVNELDKQPEISKKVFADLLILLSVFAPHITEELWQNLQYNKKTLIEQEWPKFDPEKIVEDTANIVVQINGKVRGQIEAPIEISEKDLLKQTLEMPEIQKWLEGKEIKKTVFVKGKLLSLVV